MPSPMQKGQPSANPNGRPKGSANKMTTLVKEALLRSFKDQGEHEWLSKLAETEPTAYASLLKNCIPAEKLVDIVINDDAVISTLARILARRLEPTMARAILIELEQSLSGNDFSDDGDKDNQEVDN